MTTPSDPSPLEDFSDSDQAWFARLRGLPADAHHARALAEADALSRALTMAQQEADIDARIAAAQAPAEKARRRQQLHDRLRQEGLAGPGVAPRSPWRNARVPTALAVAASLVIAVLLIPRLGRDETVYYGEAPLERGEPVIEHRADAHPKAAADALAASLQAAGLVAIQYQHGATFIIDVAVPAGIDAVAATALRKAGIGARRGTVRIEFAPDST